jgi:hypothetical protein
VVSPEQGKRTKQRGRLLALAGRQSGRIACLIIAALIGAVLIGTGTDDAGAMVGGAPPAVAGIARSVVLILGSYGSSSTACTATAVGRDLLLTAAHCVQPGADYKLVASEPTIPQFLRISPASNASRNSTEAAVRSSRDGGRSADQTCRTASGAHLAGSYWE